MRRPILWISLGFFLSGCNSFPLWRTSDSSQNRRPIGRLNVNTRLDTFHPSAELRVKVDPTVCGTKRAPQSLLWNEGTKGVENVVVWLEGPTLKPLSTDDTPRIVTSTKCEFSPRLLIVAPGTLIDFRNNDPVLHSVRAQTKLNPPDYKVQPPNLESVTMKFEKPEIIPLVNDMHPWMQAFIIVAAHSFYAVTDAKGEAKFLDIPEGSYRLKAWHEILGLQEHPQSIEINMETSGKTQSLTFIWADEPTP